MKQLVTLMKEWDAVSGMAAGRSSSGVGPTTLTAHLAKNLLSVDAADVGRKIY